MRTAITPGRGVRPEASTGFFLMLLMSLSALLLAWDMAASDAGWGALGTVHLAMQGILAVAALGSGSTGAVLWIGPRHAHPAA